MKKLTKIDLKIDNKKYKLFSLIRGADRSIYVSFLMGMEHGKYNYSKFSYHSDGKSHIKVYSAGNTKEHEIRFPQHVPLSGVRGVINTNFIVSLRGLSDILFDGVSLNEGEGKKGYLSYVEINSSEYKDITIRFFLLEKGYNYEPESTRNYKKILHINQEDIEILVTFEDTWAKPEEAL